LHAGETGPAAPPGTYGVLKPSDNPLVKPGGKIPVPTIVWEEVKVRPDHPRLLFTKETLKALAQRIEQHPSREHFEKAVRDEDPVACALMYQISGRESQAKSAIKKLLEGKTTSPGAYDVAAALVFDWTYDAMTEAERREAIDRVWAAIDVDRQSGWPRCSPYTGYPDDPRPSETPPAQWPRFYNWTFHDQDWARRYAPTLVGLLALAGHKPRALEGVRNYWEYSLKDGAMFLDHLRDGSYWQGYYWQITERVAEIHLLLACMKSACGIDYLDPKTHPYLANMGRWILYCSDPWHERVIYNYGDGEPVLFNQKVYTGLLVSGNLSRDPHVEWLAQRCTPAQRNWFAEIFYHDPIVQPVGPTELPLARAFPGTGLAVMRSAWVGHGVWASVRWADWFDMHGHPDVGSFILYCKSPLAPDSGFYISGMLHNAGYYTRTIAHNTLTVRDPAAKGPLNDGCQRTRDKRTWSFAIGADAWLYNQDNFDRGDLLAFETRGLYDYCAGNGTRAYRPELLKEFTRQAVLLRSGAFILFDRVETPRADLEKRWLMHLVGEPKIDGKLLATQVKGHIEDYDGALIVSQGREKAIVRCHALLPAQRLVRKVGGAIPEIPVTTLVRTPRTTQRMSTGSRWEWTDPITLSYNDPLTGKKLGALAIERDTPTDAEFEVTDSEVYLKLNAYERGRADEFHLKFADYKTILDLARDLGKRHDWHTAIHYLPGYEYYNEGANYPPSYRAGAWERPQELAPELLGEANDAGSWRIEVYPAKPTTRDYFLHVMRVQSNPGEEPGEIALTRDTDDVAEAKVVLGGNTYVLTFAKKGDLGGHIRVTDPTGKVLADNDFAKKIEQKD
jgi:hypothetical protein